MKKLIECVPNFSEGRDQNVIRQFTDAIETVDGVSLLDADPGASTNRTVVTFVGDPDAVVEAAFRGIQKAVELIDMLKEKEKELIDAAAAMAAHRLKTNFILHRIAEHEKTQVTKEDLDSRIRQEAARYDISPDKMRKELQQRNALDDLAEQLLLGKTLDFLKANVSVELTKEPAVKEEKSCIPTPSPVSRINHLIDAPT